jgi:nucleotide-binding universal stress UspA family protein
VVVDEDRTVTPHIDRRPDAPTSERVDHERRSKNAATRLEAVVFRSVLCGVDNSAYGRAARDQAMLLASPGGRVKLVPLPQLTHRGDRSLQDACEGFDLLALGAGADAFRALEHARIPVLIARWLPRATDLTGTILVPVDGPPESRRAVVLAGRLAAAHGGTVAILVAPRRDASFQRAIAASQRILLQATGTAPRLVGEPLPHEEIIRSTAVALPASLVILGTGHSETERRIAAQIADRVGSSVLALPE